jgi:type IV pilus assembly protein PilC
MLNSGLPINRALEVLAKQTENKKLRKCTMALEKSVEAGANLSKAMQEFPEIFDNLFISLVKAGEGTGTLGNSLIKMSIFKEREAELKSKIKGALTYPLIVLGGSTLIVILLFIFVLPKFVGFLAGMNVPLPLPTKITLGISNFLVQRWYILFGVLAVAFFSIRAFLKTKKGKTFWDGLLLKMPIIGPLIIKNSMSRFTDTLSTLFGAGVPLVQALEMTVGTMGNGVISATVDNIIERVKGGEALSGALSKNLYFTPMVIQMAIVGEESGYLEKMLAKVADFYTDEVNAATAGLAAAINPILMIFVGVIIGWVLISLYLPIFKMAGGLS